MKVGAILRAYEKNQDKLEETAARARKNALALKKVVGKVIVMVARDKDCGMLANTLRFNPGEGFPVISAGGDNSKEVLNVGVNILFEREECEIALIISGKAVDSMSKEIVEKAVREFKENKNLAVVGVTLDENLNPLIEQGFIQNTCAFWRLSYLRQVGGFTSDRGVEEVSVMSELYRQGYSSAVLKFESSDLSLRSDGKDHYEEIVRTKWERIDLELARVKSTRENIETMLSHTVCSKYLN